MKSIEISIGDFKDFIEQNSIDLNDSKIEVSTRYGFNRINAVEITAYDSQVIEIIHENGMLKTSPKHKVFTTEWCSVDSLNVDDYILTSTGLSKIITLTLMSEKHDLLDLQVENVQEYYTNGVVSHNSTLLSAITFVLFGKNSDMKGNSKSSVPVKELVNDLNKKECEVEITLNSEITIRRGITPDYLEIIDKDGKNLADKSSKTIDQTFIETELLGGMSFDMFNKINYISAKSISIPFLYQTLTQRKEFIENILDIRILFYINEVIKKKTSETKLDHRNVESKLDIINSSITIAEQAVARQEIQRNEQLLKLQELKENKNRLIQEAETAINNYNKSKAENHTQHEFIDADIETLNEGITKLQDEIKIGIYEDELRLVESKLNSTKNLMIQTKNKRDTYYNNLAGFDKCGTCPTVKLIVGEFDENSYNSSINLSTIQAKDNIAVIKSLTSKISMNNIAKQNLVSQQRSLNNSKSLKREINNKDAVLDAKILSEENIIKSLKSDLDTIHVAEVDKQSLVLLEENKADLTALYDSNVALLEQYERVKARVGDKSLKDELLGFYIPIFQDKLNELLANFMEEDEFTFSITIDSNFNLEGFKNGKSSNIFKLSEGQKSSISFALLFSWQYILSLKNSYNLNILLIDEILDIALDQSRVLKVVEHLKDISQTKPIYLISHNSDLQLELFDSLMNVTKEYGFTKYEIT